MILVLCNEEKIEHEISEEALHAPRHTDSFRDLLIHISAVTDFRGISAYHRHSTLAT